MKKTLLLTIFAFLLMAMSSDKAAYQFYNQKGKQLKFKALLKEVNKADIVLFGELHNSSVVHWLQLQLTKALYETKKDNLILGAEMFEADNQLMIDEYFQGLMKAKTFKAQSRLWDNYKTDYKPLLEFANKNKLPFIATNIPRRYASLVHKNGLEALEKLTTEAKSYIAPLPIKYDPNLKGYKEMVEMMKAMGSKHANDKLPKAQAIKDATMAHFILKNWTKGKTFLHYHGTYHSDNFEGIAWYLKQANPDLKIVTISSVEQDDIEKLEEENAVLADFMLCVPSDMTKTY